MRRFLLPVMVVVSLSACSLLHLSSNQPLATNVENALQDMVWSVEEANSVLWLSDATATQLVAGLTQAETVVSQTPNGALATAEAAVQALETTLAADSRAQPYLTVLLTTLKALG